jgi:hypothetical protein
MKKEVDKIEGTFELLVDKCYRKKINCSAMVDGKICKYTFYVRKIDWKKIFTKLKKTHYFLYDDVFELKDKEILIKREFWDEVWFFFKKCWDFFSHVTEDE